VIAVRLLFYALYVVLGSVILARMLAAGLRWESLSGVTLGVALIALGFYRLLLFARLRGGAK
jgi:hypothetical protein